MGIKLDKQNVDKNLSSLFFLSNFVLGGISSVPVGLIFIGQKVRPSGQISVTTFSEKKPCALVQTLMCFDRWKMLKEHLSASQVYSFVQFTVSWKDNSGGHICFNRLFIRFWLGRDCESETIFCFLKSNTDYPWFFFFVINTFQYYARNV